MKNDLLDPTKSAESPCCYPLDEGGKPGDEVSKSMLDIIDKGVAKISQNFNYKLYKSFPDLRYELLCQSELCED